MEAHGLQPAGNPSSPTFSFVSPMALSFIIISPEEHVSESIMLWEEDDGED